MPNKKNKRFFEINLKMEFYDDGFKCDLNPKQENLNENEKLIFVGFHHLIKDKLIELRELLLTKGN